VLFRSGKYAFINFNRKLLLGNIPLLFPKEILGVEILETVNPDQPILRICNRIKKTGYMMILDNFIFHEDYRDFINMADIIKIDFRTASPEDRKSIFQHVNSRAKKLLACKIETREDFDEAYHLGYHLFQGYFFQKPALITRAEVPGYKITYLSMLKKLYDPLFELNELEDIIKRDVSLTYKLLRFINSAAYGFKVTIRSISHALLLLGKREVKRWLTIIVMSGIGREKPHELMKVVVIRSRFCELIATEFKLHDQPTDLFLVGMFSMVDAFLDRPLPEILEELPLEEHIKSVLLGEENQTGDILKMVKAFEKGDWELFSSLADKLTLNEEKLAMLYLEAVEWTKFLSE